MKMKSILIVWIVLCCSCSSTARLQMKDGTFAEGEILSATDEEIVVKIDDNSEQILKREKIEDIDHPGNVTLVAGSALSAAGVTSLTLGIVALVSAADQRASAEASDFIFPLFGMLSADLTEFSGYLLIGSAVGFLAAGVPMIVWGADTWTSSKERSEVQGIDSVEISIGNGLGLSVKATF